MITNIIKDHKKFEFQSLEDIKVKFNHYRKIIKNGLHKLTPNQFNDLKTELNKFLNMELAFFSDTYPTKLFRITNNKKIVGEGQRLQNISQLIGPPKGLSKMGRCNLPGESVFYAALDFETAVWETQPEVGDLITTSIWKIREGQKLDMHHIFHPKKTIVNKETQNAYEAWLKALPTFYGPIKENNPDLEEILSEYYSFLTDQFMNVVHWKEKENYLVSALTSSRYLQDTRDENGFKIEAISYPSVKREYGLSNIAILNSLALERLELQEIIVFKVGETNYTKEAKPNETLKIEGFELRFDDFDFENDKIIYDGQKEINQVAEQHIKWIRQKEKTNKS